jgi:hypothetical protein
LKAIDIITARAVEIKNTRYSGEALKSQSTAITSLYVDTTDSRQTVKKSVITENSIVDLIMAIEGIGSATNGKLAISSIDNLVAIESSTNKSVGIKIQFTGSWSSAMKALLLIENLPYPVKIERVSLGMSETIGATPGKSWTLNVDTRVLVFPQK